MSIFDITLAYALPFGSALAVYVTVRVVRRRRGRNRDVKEKTRKGRIPT